MTTISRPERVLRPPPPFQFEHAWRRLATEYAVGRIDEGEIERRLWRLAGEAGDRFEEAVRATGYRRKRFEPAVVVLRADAASDEDIARIVRENVALVTSIGRDKRATLRRLLEENHDLPVRELRDRITKALHISESRAMVIARDQVLKLNAKVAELRQRELGVEEYIWDTSQDERVRGNPAGKYPDSSGDHHRLHGKRFKWSAPPVVDKKTGRRAHPGEDIQCRCQALPVLELSG